MQLPAAAQDVVHLAKEVTLISNILRQVGATLKQEYIIPSPEAVSAVQCILSLSQRLFRNIEGLISVHNAGLSSYGAKSLGIANTANVSWDDAASDRTAYFCSYLSSLKLTLSVMVQAIYTAKTIAWSSHVRSSVASEAVNNENLLMESLLVEQQRMLLRVKRLDNDYFSGATKSNFTSQAIVFGHGVQDLSSVELADFQTPKLAEMKLAMNDVEDIIHIRREAGPFAGIILHRWTRLVEIQEELARFQQEGSAVTLALPAPKVVDWQSRQASVESDDDDDLVHSQAEINRPPYPTGPVLMHIDELGKHIDTPQTSQAVASQVPHGKPSARNLHSPNTPMTRSFSTGAAQPIPMPEKSRSRVASFSTPGVAPSNAPCSPSQLSHSAPRASFSTVDAIARPILPAINTTTLSTVSTVDFAPQRVPWRLRLRGNYWDYIDAKIVHSNSNREPTADIVGDRSAFTEISSQFISRRAVDERDHECTTTQKPVDCGHRTRFETIHCIHRGLSYRDVEDLIRRSAQIRRRDSVQQQPDRPFAAFGPSATRSMSAAAGSALDRARTAPSPILAPLLGSASPNRGILRNNTSDAGYYLSPKIPLSSSFDGEPEHGPKRRDSKRDVSRSRHDRRHRDEGSGGREKDRERRHRGLTRASGLALLGGSGLWALLEGLPDALHHAL